MPASTESRSRSCDDSVQKHMTRLRMKMVQQKITNEKEKILNRPGSQDSTQDELENQARLQQAMLRRQELLDKIRRQQLVNDEYKRPRTYSARRRYTPSPLPAPPTRRSMPEYDKYNNTYYNPDANRRSPKQGMQPVKHVVEHVFDTKDFHLPPIQNQPQQQQYQPAPVGPPAIQPPPQQNQPSVIFQDAPAPQIMQQPAPQIIQAPPPQQIIQRIPQPIIQDFSGGGGGNHDNNRSMFNKAEMGEMMMMQNMQMHQMVMQKLMIGSLGGGLGLGGGGSDSNHGDSHCCHGSSGGGGDTISVQCVPRPNPGGGAVHHHHYSQPPQSQPPVHHYTSVPQMGMRGGPMQDYSSAYTAPMSYSYGSEDDNNDRNFFVYH